MEVILLPDKRKATLISQVTSEHAKVKLEDGREVMWPVTKIQQPLKEGEDTIKLVKIPAVDRLNELERDRKRLGIGLDGQTDKKYKELLHQLRREAAKEFIDKWGLI